MKCVLKFAACMVLSVCAFHANGLSFAPSGYEESFDIEQEQPSKESSGREQQSALTDDDSAAGLVSSGTVVESGNPWKGTWNFVLESESDEESGKYPSSGTGYSMFAFTVSKKSAVTVSGTMANGVKVSVKTKLYAGDSEELAWIPVIVDSKKAGRFSFVVQISTEGELDVGATSEWDALKLKKSFLADFTSCTGGLGGLGDEDDDGERMFSFDGDIDELPDDYELLDDISPDGVGVTCTAKKWKAEKAGKVKFSKKTGDYEASDTNPAGLKLSYSRKKGTFSGSFTLYGMKETNSGKYKVKKFKASVKGIVVAGCGYGTATIKNVGTFSVSVE